MKNWTIEETNENLVFKYNSEVKMLFTPNGEIHVDKDLIIYSKKINPNQDKLSTILSKF